MLHFHFGQRRGYLMFAVAASAFFLKLLQARYKRWAINKKYVEIRARKRQHNQGLIQAFVQDRLAGLRLDPAQQCQILNADTSTLRSFIQQGLYTITDILLTFIKRTIDQHQQFNLISEVIFEEAYKEARKQDEELASDKSLLTRYPLFGIPISLKDFLAVKGVDSTFGQTVRCFQPDEQDCYQVKLVKLARGIIFAKTNTPQMGKSLESQNFITGISKNPHSPDRSPGGSSGGEAALIAAHGSVLGLGSDLGGSLRIPASFSGVATIKPSTVRWHRYEKYMIPVKQVGWNQIAATAGPMARCVDDLVLMMDVQLRAEHFQAVPLHQKDIHYRPLPFRHDLYVATGNLKIGILDSLELWPAVESNRRAVKEVAELLKNQGHTLVNFKIPDSMIRQAMDIFFSILGGLDENGEIFKDMLGSEEHIPGYNVLLLCYNLPSWFKRVVVGIYELAGRERQAIMMKAFSRSYRGVDVLQILGEMQLLIEKFKMIWEQAGIDVLVLPTAATVALKHGQSTVSQLFGCYSSFFNFVNFTAGSLPVTHVRADEQFYGYQYDVLDKMTQECMKNSENLPVSVQVVTKPFEDELCLRVMKMIEQGMHFRDNLVVKV